MGATFHPRYDVHIAAGPETRREAAEHAFHPPRGVLVPDPSDAPRVETGQLDETTRGALSVYQSDRGMEPHRRTRLRHVGVIARGGDRLPARPHGPTPG